MKLNKIIKVLILSDIVLLGGLGLVGPIFAVFLTNRVSGGDIKVAGYAAALYLVINSLAVLPVSHYLDKNHGEKDDLWAIVVGNLLAVLVFLGYIFASLPLHVYALQVIYALGMALSAPGYNAIFTRHINKGREAFGWSARSALVGLSGGVTGALGGVVADRFGFNLVFVLVAIFIFLSALTPLLIFNNVSSANKKVVRAKPRNLRLKND